MWVHTPPVRSLAPGLPPTRPQSPHSPHREFSLQCVPLCMRPKNTHGRPGLSTRNPPHTDDGGRPRCPPGDPSTAKAVSPRPVRTVWLWTHPCLRASLSPLTGLTGLSGQLRETVHGVCLTRRHVKYRRGAWPSRRAPVRQNEGLASSRWDATLLLHSSRQGIGQVSPHVGAGSRCPLQPPRGLVLTTPAPH